MANSTEPIIVQIVNEAGAAISGGSTKKTGEGSGLLATTAKITSIIGIAQEIAKLVSEAMNTLIKPIRTVLLGILKMVAQLLRPFSDMILILLIPILQFLKPLIKVFNDMMKPFRTVAFKLMSQASKTGNVAEKNLLMTMALSALFEGFNFGILGIAKELLKGLTNGIIDTVKELVIGPLLDLFKVIVPDWIVSDDVFESTKQAIFSGLDDAKVTINNALDTGLNSLRDSSLKKYDNLLKTFTDKVDWKSPEDMLAAKMSSIIANAASRATGGNGNINWSPGNIASGGSVYNPTTGGYVVNNPDAGGYQSSKDPLVTKTNSSSGKFTVTTF